MPSGPNLDLYSVFFEYSEGEGYENMKISRHMGIGDIETHTDCPRCFWGIGSTVGWDTPRSIKIGHAHVGIILRPPGRCFTRQCMFTWAKFRLPSTESLKNKTRVVGGGKGMVLARGGYTCGVVLRTRDPHSPSCGHFHTHFQKTQISRNTGMRDKRNEGWAKQWWWWWGEDKTSRPTRI